MGKQDYRFDKNTFAKEWLLVAVILLLLGLQLLYDLRQRRELIEHQASANLENHSLVLKETLERRLNSIDAALLYLRDNAQTFLATKASENDLARQLVTLEKTLEDVRTLIVFDATGHAVASNRAELVGRNFSGREYFRALQDSPKPDRLYIGTPFTTVLGVYSLNLVRPIYGANGEFAGAVSATIDTTDLQELLYSLHTSADTRLSISHVNGKLLVLTPDGLATPGSAVDKPSGFFIQHMASGQSDNLFQGMSGLTGSESLMSMRSLRSGAADTEGGLVIGAARDVSSILAPWHEVLKTRLALYFLMVAIATGSLWRSQRQSRKSRRSITDLLSALPDGVIVQDQHGKTLYSNDSARQMFGADSPINEDKVFPVVEAPSSAEIRFTDLSGVSGWAEFRSHQIDWDGAPRIVVSLRDISERKATEAHLKKLANAIEQSPESIVFTNFAGTIEYVNDAFLQVTGYSREEVIGQNPRILQSGYTPHERYVEMWANLQAGKSWRGEFINKRKDGRTYLEQATLSPIRQADGTITHYVAVKADITEQRRIEQELAAYQAGLEHLVQERTLELAQAKKTAEKANQAKSNFLANMSHEIRTPINAIIGLNYLLLQGELKPDQADKVHKVSDSANHLLQVITDILDLSRIESGKVEIECAPFSPMAVIKTTAAMIADRAAQKGIEICIDAENLPPYLLGDEMRLRQVLLNFAGNAVKFTERGRIALTAEVLAIDGEKHMCRFSVRDTGIGMPAAAISRLFKPFEQLDNSTTRRYGGSGLGLAIAQHLSQLMGGEVGVESTPGVGSTFWITTPFNLAHAARNESAAPADAEFRLLGHVLLVEDDPINREIGADLLHAVGLRVTTAENGAAAVDWVIRDKFDLILMDVQMPVLDGLAATEQIRGMPAGAAIPIIALTANAFSEDRILCRDAGMTEFLAKPVIPENLYAMLSRYLPASDPPLSGSKNELISSGSMDDAALTNALHHLRHLLSTGDSEAEIRFREIRSDLTLAFPEEARRLAALIPNYNFEPALPLVDALIAKLTSTPDQCASLG